MSLIFLLLFALPMAFTIGNGKISWQHMIKIWQDRVLLIPLFAINHWLLIPRFVLSKKYTSYFLMAFMLIFLITFSYYMFDERLRKKHQPKPPPKKELAINETKKPKDKPGPKGSTSIPPFAGLLLFSLLIVVVDTGLSYTKHWHIIEEDKVRLEKENIQAQLGMLRNQISPHFFMNTLNNIYALIQEDKKRSRESVMKLSKLMRYLLYENRDGKILLSKEFEFIKSYIDLMKLRFVDDIDIKLSIPKTYTDVEIPILLFISYLENAFKFGTSYEQKSVIEIVFTIEDGYLLFLCTNTINVFNKKDVGGIGLKNSKQRLDLLFKDSYDLNIHETDETYTVKLKIPIR